MGSIVACFWGSCGAWGLIGVEWGESGALWVVLLTGDEFLGFWEIGELILADFGGFWEGFVGWIGDLGGLGGFFARFWWF